MNYDEMSQPVVYKAGNAENEDYFRFTRGRFVSDEKHEMSQRYVRLDVHQLARLVAEALGSKFCIAIEKDPDGM